MKIPICSKCLFVFLLMTLPIFADTVTDPIQAYTKLANLSSGRIIYKWEVDLNNDGKKEIMLDKKETPEELSKERKEHDGDSQIAYERGFIVYIPNLVGSGYNQIQETNFGTYSERGTALSVDIRRCFIGKITQLNKWGLVSVEIESGGERHPTSVTVYAYTLENDHLKLTTLAQYEPTKGGNEIYDQYLSDSHRTQVKLEEIAVF